MNKELCPVCDSEIEVGASICQTCGADLKLLRDEQNRGMKCPECGNELLDMDSECPKCGAKLQKEIVVFQCPACGAEVGEDATECPNCGVQFLTEEEMSRGAETPSAVESVPQAKTDELKIIQDLHIHPAVPEEVHENTAPVEASPQRLQPREEDGVTTQAPREEQQPVAPMPSKAAEEQRQKETEKRGFLSVFSRGKKKEERRQPAVQAPEQPVSTPKTRPVQDANAGTVEWLKKMVRFASEASIDISAGKSYLDLALEMIKSGNGDHARLNLELARKAINNGIKDFFALKMNTMRKQIEIEGVQGERKAGLESIIRDMEQDVSSGKYNEAMELVRKFQSELSPRAAQYGEAGELVKKTAELLKLADEFDLDCSSSRIIHNEARKQLELGDWNTAIILARQSYSTLLKSIPESIAKEIMKAKNELVEAKLQGASISKQVLVLKEANAAYNSGRYDDALRYLGQFRREFEIIPRVPEGSAPASR